MTPPRAAGPVDAEKSPAAIWKPLDARAVTVEGGVWARAQSVNRDAALPHGHMRTFAALGHDFATNYAWANREPGAMRIWIPRGTA